MADELIHADLVEVAFDRSAGTAFERFVHAFYPPLAGVNFVPLGGVHDGGADALQAPSSLWGDSDPGIFYQASIQRDHRAKIKDTVQRLREFGRKPTALIYVTAQRIPKTDAEERLLSIETGVAVRIRDRVYIAAHINDSPETRNAFRTHMGPYLDLLKKIGAAQLISQSQHVRSPAIYVFLSQEVERRGGDLRLSEAVGDSLILWVLEGTDPDQGKFKTRAEIVYGIAKELPFAGPIVQ